MAAGSPTDIPDWLNTKEAARRLGVTPRTLYRFIDSGELPAYRFGRVIRLMGSDVASFVQRCRIAPGTLSSEGTFDEIDAEAVDLDVEA